VLVPISSRNGLISDVWLLWVVLWVTVWLRGAGHGRGLRNVFWVDGLHASGGLMGGHCAGGVREGGKVKGLENRWMKVGAGSSVGDACSRPQCTKLQQRRSAHARWQCGVKGRKAGCG
jgi:hypothetical protein